MSIGTRFFNNIPSGTKIVNIIGGVKSNNTGYIKQIIINQLSGPATTMQVQVRYNPDLADNENLVYLYDNTASALLVDSQIDAPFDLVNQNTPGDLTLIIITDSPGIFDARIDFEFLDWRR